MRKCGAARTAGLRRSAIGVAVFTSLFAIWIAVIQLEWQALDAAGLLVTVPNSGANWWLDNS